MTPLNDRVVVKPDPKIEKTAGGIIIPDTVTEVPQYGTVVAISANLNVPLSEGDRVLFNKYAGIEMTYLGVAYLVVRYDDLAAYEPSKNYDEGVIK